MINFAKYMMSIEECMKKGYINQQKALLSALVAFRPRTKAELAKVNRKTIRCIEQQLKTLYQLGIVENVNGLIIPKDFSIDQILNILELNIDISSENNFALNTTNTTTTVDNPSEEVVSEVSFILSSHPEKIRQAIINAKIAIPDEQIIECAKITKENNPKSPVGYFVTVMRNYVRNEDTPQKEVSSSQKETRLSSEYEKIFGAIKRKVGLSFSLFKNSKITKHNNYLFLACPDPKKANLIWSNFKDVLRSLGFMSVYIT